MFGDHYAPAKQLLALLQSVVGPTHEVSQLGEAPTKGQWEHLAQYSGRPLRLVISHRYVSGSVGRLMGAFVGVPLGERPIEVFVDLSPPGPDAMQLLSGMPSLLPYVGVVGFPEEVVRAALDERTVAEMRAAAAACQLRSLTREGNWLTTFVSVETPQGLSPGPTPMPAPSDLVRVFDFMQAASDRFVSAFDHAHDEVHRTGGPAAAVQWLAAQHSAARVRHGQRKRGAFVAIAVAITIMLAVVAAIIVLGSFLLG
jgi:hypothetical protein